MLEDVYSLSFSLSSAPAYVHLPVGLNSYLSGRI
jgi:hypothetical protein